MGTYYKDKLAVLKHAAFIFLAISLTTIACAPEESFDMTDGQSEVLDQSFESKEVFENLDQDEFYGQSIEPETVIQLKSSVPEQDAESVLEFNIAEIPSIDPADEGIQSDGEGQYISESTGLSITATETGLTFKAPGYSKEMMFDQPISKSDSESLAVSILTGLQMVPDFTALETENKAWWVSAGRFLTRYIGRAFKAATSYAAQRLCQYYAPREYQSECNQIAVSSCGGSRNVHYNYVTCGSAIRRWLGFESRPVCVIKCR